MSPKTIGGGLLTAAGVIGAIVVQAAGLKLNPIAGLVLLFICALAAVAGLVLVFLPGDKKTSDDPTVNITTHNQSGGVAAHTINQGKSDD
jgi:hypothetical protein